MRQFVNFILGAFAVAFARVIALAVLAAMSISPETVLAFWGEPPSWVAHWGARLGFLAAALLMMGWIFFTRSRIEIAIPDQLKRRRFASFAQVADQLADTELGYSRDEVFQRLLRALWVGDFESRSGNGRLTLPTPRGVRVVDGQLVPFSGENTTALGEHLRLDADAEPPRTVFNRELLLRSIVGDPNISAIYPTLAHTMRDKDTPWATRKKRINFRLLANIHLRCYTNEWRSTYLHRLTMKRADLIRWFGRARDGKYDQEPDWQ